MSAVETGVVIVGSGFGGLGLAIRLRQRGERDFIVLERSHEVGGVWRDNTYPGCACDVPSHLYSFSFAPNPRWSRAYASREEIQAYLRGCADRFGVRAHIRFGHEVTAAAWDERLGRWRVTTSREEFVTRALVSGSGALSEPAIPPVPGLARFTGKVMHTARWDQRHDLRGEDVCVIGTGASATQLIPQIQPLVRRLTVVQRSPAWVMPRNDRAISPLEQRLFAQLPWAHRLWRAQTAATHELSLLPFRSRLFLPIARHLALSHLRRSVPDAALREKLTPHYEVGCKRILISDDYLPALTKDNVTLVTRALTEVRPRAIVTADGQAHAADTIVFGTGFHVTDHPFWGRVRGRRGASLTEVWAGAPRAHLGTTVAGFPNLFLLFGPNTGLGHTSVLLMLEAQLEHIVRALAFLRGRPRAAIEPRPEAQAAFVDEVDARMRGTVWTTGGCSSWYLDANGRNAALWPLSTGAFRRRVSPFHPADFQIVETPQPSHGHLHG